MTAEDFDSLSRRRDQALVRLDEGHRALTNSLTGLDPEEAFLGSRWSVREVLLHLDSENFIDALEKIARGEHEMLPPFSTREEELKKEIAHMEETHQRFRSLVAGLNPEQLGQPVTPPNPENAFPGLSLLELIERVCGHEASHARQIELTRKYVAAFRSQERALNIVALGDGSPVRLSQGVKDLLNMADYVVGEPAALAVVAPLVRGVPLTLRPGNRDEMLNRCARETKEGLWAVVCVMGDGGEGNETVASAHRHADSVAVHRPAE